jgi:hypothetical protein
VTLPFRRRTDRGSAHERARAAAARRLDGPIDPVENDWLDSHLVGCAACRAVSDAYESDRFELRASRRQTIEPPRDLWARTSAAIEREAAAGPGDRRTRRRLAPSVVPLGAMSGLLVVAVVFGAALLSSRPAPSVGPTASAPLIAVSLAPTVGPSPEPTRLSVPHGDVDYLALGDDGKLAIHTTEYTEVCPDNGATCTPAVGREPREIDVPSAPEQAIMAPNEEQLVVEVDGTLIVVPAPTPVDTTSAPTEPPAVTPGATASAEPTTSLSPAPSESPSAASTEPSPVPPSAAPSSAPPSTAPPATAEPSPSPTPAAGPVAIAEDVVLVGEIAFDASGARFAFSARPADGSLGPDIFVWTVGEAAATPITTDHRSVFDGWQGDLVLGSRPVDPGATETVGEAFVVDPATGAEAIVDSTIWRPAVDPSGAAAVYWDGTIAPDESGVEWLPADGRLVVGRWAGTPEVAAAPEEGDASAEPATSPEPTSPLPTTREVEVLFDGPVRHWEARWDEAGSHVALWVADADDPTIGRLSLYTAEEGTGQVDADEPALRGEVARPGFSIGEGHLAWATKDGQDGKASHVRIVAWTDDGIGQIETPSGEDVLVVQR